MKLRDIRLRYAPGMPEGIRKNIEIGEGLTFIVGPNASGKSTLARTMRLAFWPRQNPAAIDAMLRLVDASEQVHTVDIRSGHCTQQLLRAEERSQSAAGLYTLGLAELLHADNDADHAFAQRLQTELYGGVPVNEIRKDIQTSQKQKRAPKQNLKTANKAIAAARRKTHALLDNEKALKRLRGDLEEAQHAETIVEALDALRETRVIAREREDTQTQLAALPSSLQNLRKDDVHTRSECQQQFVDAQRLRKDSQDALEDHQAQLAAIDEVWKALEPESLHVGEQCYSELQAAESTLSDASAQHLLAQEQKLAAQTRVFGAPLQHPVDETLKDALKAALRDVRNAESQCGAARELRDGFQDVGESTGATSSQLNEQITALRTWLRASQGAENATPSWPAWVVALCALVSVGVMFGYMPRMPQSDAIWAYVLLAISVVTAVLSVVQAWWIKEDVRVENSLRPRRQQQILDTGVHVQAWTVEAVRAELVQCEERLIQRLRYDAAQTRKRGYERKYEDANRVLQDKQQQLQEAAKHVGIRADILTLDVAEVFARTDKWVDAEHALSKATAALKNAESNQHNCEDYWRRWLSQHNIADEAARVGEGAIVDLAERKIAEANRLRGEIRNASSRVAREDSAVTQARQQLETLSKRLAEWGASDAELERGIALWKTQQELLSEFSSRDREFTRALHALEESRSVLCDANVLPERLRDVDTLPAEELLALEVETLQSVYEQCSAKAEQLQPLIEETSTLAERLNQAQRAADIEDAFAAKERALAECGAQSHRRAQAFLEEYMLDWSVEQGAAETASMGATSSLKHANDWLRRFTLGTFELRVSPSGNLVGYAVEARAERALYELSDATRVQTLLAARLAAIRDAEAGGRPLPLILDEVFSTTDPRRFEAIAGALSDIVATGRQVIYLTADPGEWTRWNALQTERPLVEAHVQWLTRDIMARSSGVAIPTVDVIDKPTGSDPKHWAQALGVDAPSMEVPVDGWPLLWMLPDSLDSVYQAHIQYVKTAGQALAFVQTIADAALWDAGVHKSEEITERLRRRIRMLRAVRERWLRGHNRAVRWEDVEQSDAVSATFEERVREVFVAYSHDPEAFLEQVGELSGFRTNKLEELRDYLLENKVLAQEPPPEREELQMQALSAVDARTVDAVDRAWLGHLLLEL